MAYKTGRSRTYNSNGTVTGNVAFGMFDGTLNAPCGLPNTPLAVAAQVANASATWTAGDVTFVYEITGPFMISGNYWWGMDVSLVVYDIGGHTNLLSASEQQVFGPYAPFWGMDEPEVSGTWSITYPIEEFAELSDTGAFPSFGGSSALSPPYHTKLTLNERMVLGGAIAYELDINGITLSGSGTISRADPVNYVFSATCEAYNLTVLLNCADHTYHASSSVTASLFDAGVSGYTRTNGDVTATVAGLGGSIDIASGSVGQSGELAYSGSPSKSYALAGQVNAWTAAYPAALTVKVDRASGDSAHSFAASGGSFSDSNTQRRYSAASTLNGVAEGNVSLSPVSVDEYLNLRCWIDPASLTAAGDDATDWRIMLRGHVFGNWGISQAASVTVDDGAAVSVPTGAYRGAWSGSGGATVAAGAGEIEVTTGEGIGTARRVFSTSNVPGAGFSGYRYLRLKIRADDDGKPYTVALGGKTWAVDYTGADLEAGTAAGTAYIDLCAQSAATDDQDHKYPLPTSDGRMWGVTGATSLLLGGLEAETVYYVDEVALCVHPSTPEQQITVLPAFTQFEQQQAPAIVGETSTSTFVRRGMQGDTDGRLSLELPDWFKFILTTGGGSETITYSPVSIAAAITGVNGPGNPALEPEPLNAGWTMTGTGTATDPGADGLFADWLNCNRPSFWLYGAGLLWSKLGAHTTFRWYSGIDLDASSSRGLPAQMLFDELEWYPGCDDVFGYTDTPAAGVVNVRAGKVMRGQAWGLVVTPSGAVAGSTVTLQVSPAGATHGSGTSDSRGEYFTGTSWAREGVNYDTIGPTGTVTRIMAGRYRYRACFGETGEGLTYEVSEATRHYRAYVETTGKIKVGTAQNLLPLVWDDVDSGIEGSRPCLGIERHGKAQRLWLSYLDGTAGKAVYSEDEGTTWSEPVTIAEDVSHLRFVITPQTTFHFFWYDGGAIKGVVYDSRANVIVEEFDAVPDSADDDDIDCRSFQGALGEHRIGLAYRSGGDLMFVSASDMVTFS